MKKEEEEIEKKAWEDRIHSFQGKCNFLNRYGQCILTETLTSFGKTCYFEKCIFQKILNETRKEKKEAMLTPDKGGNTRRGTPDKELKQDKPKEKEWWVEKYVKMNWRLCSELEVNAPYIRVKNVRKIIKKLTEEKKKEIKKLKQDEFNPM